MALKLDHTIVPVRDHEAAAREMAGILGLEYNGTWGHFAPVKVNETLTLDFDTSEHPHSNHYAFLADDADFDAILARVKAAGIAFGSGPGRAAPPARTATSTIGTAGGASISSVGTATFGR